VLRLLYPAAIRHPEGFGHLLQALDFQLEQTKGVALVAPGDGGPEELAELAAVVRAAGPHLVLAGGPEGSERPELMRDRPAVDGKPTAYVCENFACQAPVTDADALAAQIRDDVRDGH